MSKRRKNDENKTKYVIVGGGIAAISCLRELSSLVVTESVTLITASSVFKEV